MKKIFITILLLFLVFLMSCTLENEGSQEYLTADDVKKGDYYIMTYDSENFCEGTTLFTDNRAGEEKIIEMDMEGNIVWEYGVPEDIHALEDPQKGLSPGFDAEILDNGNILIEYPKVGVYEMTREGTVVWSYQDREITHDADKLDDGNILFVFSGDGDKESAQVKEVNQEGEIVWEWHAIDWFNEEPWNLINRANSVKENTQGDWLHTNAVQRLDDGTTLISPRNFDITIIVDETGKPIWIHEWGKLSTLEGDDAVNYVGFDPHEPYITEEGTLLTCLQRASPYQAVEIDRETEEILWTYSRQGLQTARDCDRLANGNTLITAAIQEDDRESTIFEVTPDGEIVWEMRIKDTPAEDSPGIFYKAERYCEI